MHQDSIHKVCRRKSCRGLGIIDVALWNKVPTLVDFQDIDRTILFMATVDDGVSTQW